MFIMEKGLIVFFCNIAMGGIHFVFTQNIKDDHLDHIYRCMKAPCPFYVFDGFTILL